MTARTIPAAMPAGVILFIQDLQSGNTEVGLGSPVASSGPITTVPEDLLCPATSGGPAVQVGPFPDAAGANRLRPESVDWTYDQLIPVEHT